MCSPSGCWLSPPRTDSRGSSTRGYGAMTAVRSVKEPGRRLPADGAGTGWVRTALRAPLSPTTPWSAWARTDGVIDCWQILGPQRIRNTGNAYAGPAATVAMAKGGRYSNQARICIRRTQGGAPWHLEPAHRQPVATSPNRRVSTAGPCGTALVHPVVATTSFGLPLSIDLAPLTACSFVGPRHAPKPSGTAADHVPTTFVPR